MIRIATPDDFKTILSFYESIGRSKQDYFDECAARGCDILIAEEEGRPVGSAVVNWTPKYSLYQKLNIPEIQDIFVIEEARRKGHASAMISFFEKLAKDRKCGHAGISVALSKEYGPAQRLYFKLGYAPDGNGVTYDRSPTEQYRSYPLDDDLCLMMVKVL